MRPGMSPQEEVGTVAPKSDWEPVGDVNSNSWRAVGDKDHMAMALSWTDP